MPGEHGNADVKPTPMPWVKVYTEMLDDPKVRRMSEAAQLRFVQLILLAGVCDCEGLLVMSGQPMSDEDIAWRLRVPAEACRSELAALEAVGMVEHTEAGWRVRAFAERQGRKHSDERARWRGWKAGQRARDAGGNVLPLSSDVPPDVLGESSDGPRDVKRIEGEGEEEGEERRGEAEVEGADAPARPESPAPSELKKPKRAQSKTDPRTKAPEIQTFFKVTGQYPNRQLYEEVIVAVQGRTEKQLAPYYKEWLRRGYNPKALTWLTEWAAAGAVPDKQRGNGNGAENKGRAALLEYRQRRGLNGK